MSAERTLPFTAPFRADWNQVKDSHGWVLCEMWGRQDEAENMACGPLHERAVLVAELLNANDQAERRVPASAPALGSQIH